MALDSGKPRGEKEYGPWGLLFVLSMSLCICMLGIGIVNPLLPLYAVRMGAGGAFLGAVMGAFSLSRMTATFFSGPMADRFPRRTLMLGGLSLYAAASVGYIFASKAWHLMAVRLLNGVGSAFVIPVAMAIGAEVAPPGKEGRFFGTMQMATYLGVGLGPLLSGVTYEHWGVKAPFLVMFVSCSVAVVASLIKVPKGIGDSSHDTKSLWRSMGGILADPVLFRVMLYQLMTTFGRGMTMLLIPILANRHGLSVSQIGYLVAGVSISSALLQQVSGWLADRISKRWLAVVSCILTGSVLLALPLPRTFAGFMLVSVLYGGANAIGIPATLAFVSQRSHIYGSGVSMGAYNIAFGIGMTAGPILGGSLESHGMEGTAVAIVAACLAVVSAVMAHPCLKERRPDCGSVSGAGEESELQ